MIPIQLNQIRKWNSRKHSSHRDLFGQVFIVVKENKPNHELDDEPTCDIRYLSQTTKGIIIREYYTDFVERYSEIVSEENIKPI